RVRAGAESAGIAPIRAWAWLQSWPCGPNGQSRVLSAPMAIVGPCRPRWQSYNGGAVGIDSNEGACMRLSLKAALSAVIVVAPLALVASQAESSVSAAPADHYRNVPHNATTKIAGLQHWCGTNGITCAEPARTWEELAGYKAAIKKGAHIFPYIGHD